MTYLSENNVLYNFQSGFRKFHSTDSSLSYLHDKITKGFESSIMIRMVLNDLQKAFDTIDRNISIKKCIFLVLLVRLSSGKHYISKTESFSHTVQKMKFSIKVFFSKCDQIRSFLRIWSHLLKKSLMENFIFVQCQYKKRVFG